MKKGLVLEGGALRGMFTCGVTDVLMENDVSFDGMVGVSAGAAFGCNIKSGQAGRAIRYNLKYCNDKRYTGWMGFLKTGNLFNTDFVYGELPDNLDVFDKEAFEKNPMEFYLVCTDVETGKPLYHKYESYSDHGYDWIRASASMPLASHIVEIDDLKLLDGGVSDSIPVKFFLEKGYERLVVVLTQPLEYTKKRLSLMPLAKAVYRDYPGLVAAMENRHIMYNQELKYIAKLEAEGKILVIRPKEKLAVSKVEKDPEKLRKIYDEGRSIAAERLSEIKAYLA